MKTMKMHEEIKTYLEGNNLVPPGIKLKARVPFLIVEAPPNHPLWVDLGGGHRRLDLPFYVGRVSQPCAEVIAEDGHNYVAVFSNERDAINSGVLIRQQAFYLAGYYV